MFSFFYVKTNAKEICDFDKARQISKLYGEIRKP